MPHAASDASLKWKGRFADVRRRHGVTALIVMGVVAVVLALKFVPPFRDLTDSFELRTVDFRFELRGVRPAPDNVLIIDIDEAGLTAMGQWPWPRATHGELIRRLKALGAREIVYDVLFADVSRYGAGDDQAFSDALRDTGNVFLPVHTAWGGAGTGSVTDVLPQRFLYSIPVGKSLRPLGGEAVPPLPMFLKYAAGAGTVSMPPDVDGKYRHLPLLLGQRQAGAGTPDGLQIACPSIALDVARHALGIASKEMSAQGQHAVRMGSWKEIPVHEYADVMLGFYGPELSIPHVSCTAILADDQALLPRLRALLKDRIVVVGVTAPGFGDSCATPFEKVRSGVELLGTAIDNIIKDDWLVEVPPWVNAFTMILMAILIGGVSTNLSATRGAIYSAALLAVYLAVAMDLFLARSVVIDIVCPTLAGFLTYASIMVVHRKHAEKMLENARRMEREMEIGRRIQGSFLPESLPSIPGWEVAAHFHAARECAGDFYDAFLFPGRKTLVLVVADVCDKGVGAALFMGLFRSLIRAFAETYGTIAGAAPREAAAGSAPPAGADVLDPAILQRIMERTNDYIAVTHSKSNMFATIFLAALEPDSGRLVYVNGGHEAPVIMGTGGIKATLSPTGPAVGMMPDMPFQTGEVRLTADDRLVAFTDGVTEAMDAKGRLFGHDRLLATILKNPGASARGLLDIVMADVGTHTAGTPQSDDITMIAVRRWVNRPAREIEGDDASAQRRISQKVQRKQHRQTEISKPS